MYNAVFNNAFDGVKCSVATRTSIQPFMLGQKGRPILEVTGVVSSKSWDQTSEDCGSRQQRAARPPQVSFSTPQGVRAHIIWLTDSVEQCRNLFAWSLIKC